MRIFIAKSVNTTNDELTQSKQSLIEKFREIDKENFVSENPNIILFISGGSEHNVAEHINAEKRYCFLASKKNNSWAAATEVKAFCNEKGVKTKIFDIDTLASVDVLKKYFEPKFLNQRKSRLGLIGDPSQWIVTGMPDEEILQDVLDIETVKIESEKILNNNDSIPDKDLIKTFQNNQNTDIEEIAKLLNTFNQIIEEYSLDAIALDCYKLIREKNITACLPFSFLNSEGFPAICEGDLCSAATMIVCQRLIGVVPWMANLIHVDNEFASFAHCTVPLNMPEEYKTVKHFESGLQTSIKGTFSKQQITVFRIDSKLETCFIALGTIHDSDIEENTCGTSIKVKLSSKSLFLINEQPLGNHHLIVQGNQTDIFAEYFCEKGFRIT